MFLLMLNVLLKTYLFYAVFKISGMLLACFKILGIFSLCSYKNGSYTREYTGSGS